MDDTGAGFIPPIIIQKQTAGSMTYIYDESARNAPDLKSPPPEGSDTTCNKTPSLLMGTTAAAGDGEGLDTPIKQLFIVAPTPPPSLTEVPRPPNPAICHEKTQAPATTDPRPSPPLDLDPSASPPAPADSDRAPGPPANKLDQRPDGRGGAPSLPKGTTAAAGGGEGLDTPIKQLFIVAPSPPPSPTEAPRSPNPAISHDKTQAPVTTDPKLYMYLDLDFDLDPGRSPGHCDVALKYLSATPFFDFDPDPGRSPGHYDAALKYLGATQYFDFDSGPGRSPGHYDAALKYLGAAAYFDYDPDPGRSPGHYDVALKYLSASPIAPAHFAPHPGTT
jgi:hypothetical protein